MTAITMKLSDKTIERVERIKAITQETNRTRIIATGIELLDFMIKELNLGGKIIIRKRDGNEETILIAGL